MHVYYEHATKDDAERLIADIRRASRAPAQARVVRDQNRRGRTDIPRAGEGDLKVALLVGPLFLLNAFEILQYKLHALARNGLFRVSTCRVLASAKYVPPDRLLATTVGGNCLAAIEDSGHPRCRKSAIVIFRKLSQVGQLLRQAGSLRPVTFSVITVAVCAVPDV
jgi:hypothetical protein